jgi:bifunctional UDP-N-acetylglucosamine pyrophosphorylase/glucosamine-1-phosphate N-acetyltransferase
LLTSNTLAELLQEHQNAGATLSLLTAKLDDAKNYGRIVRNDKGQLLQIVEDKDATPEQKAIKEINSGIYCFQWPQISNGLAALKNDNQQKEYYLTDLVAWAVKEKHTVASKVAQDVSEVSGINSRAELAEASRLLNERALRKLALDSGVTIVDWQSTWIAPEVEIGKDSTVLPGCYLTGKIEIGASCVIGPQTVMKGPVRIGDRSTVLLSYLTNSQVGADCRVGPFAHLRDNAQAADNVRIGNYVEIKNSQIGSHTNVSHLSYVGDASLGSQVNIGAGTITANYDHVSKLKSRTTMKDGASTGCNAVLVAPVVVGKESVVAAGTVVTKDVPDGALAVGRARQEVKAGWTESKKRKLDGQAATKTGKS